ncbi:MAG: hypothetical protein RR988_02250 [Clostridia bacterium]
MRNVRDEKKPNKDGFVEFDDFNEVEDTSPLIGPEKKEKPSKAKKEKKQQEKLEKKNEKAEKKNEKKNEKIEKKNEKKYEKKSKKAEKKIKKRNSAEDKEENLMDIEEKEPKDIKMEGTEKVCVVLNLITLLALAGCIGYLIVQNYFMQ